MSNESKPTSFETVLRLSKDAFRKLSPYRQSGWSAAAYVIFFAAGWSVCNHRNISKKEEAEMLGKFEKKVEDLATKTSKKFDEDLSSLRKRVAVLAGNRGLTIEQLDDIIARRSNEDPAKK